MIIGFNQHGIPKDNKKRCHPERNEMEPRDLGTDFTANADQMRRFLDAASPCSERHIFSLCI